MSRPDAWDFIKIFRQRQVSFMPRYHLRRVSQYQYFGKVYSLYLQDTIKRICCMEIKLVLRSGQTSKEIRLVGQWE